jgi:hypothetical protein
MNSMPMDMTMALPQSPPGYPIETFPRNFGRCFPVPDEERRNRYYRHWAHDLFDFFSTRVPENDFLPNVPEDLYGYVDGLNNWVDLPKPDPVANTDASRANMNEPPSGTQGLININTANWFVLSQLPLIVQADGSVDKVKTLEAARTMDQWLSYRGRKNQFVNFFHFNDFLWHKQVPDPGNRPRLEDDPDAYFEPINRLSNLITLRSDSFTAYVLVEGWRDAYTPDAKRVLQRRKAFIIDRSNVTETNRDPQVTPIPVD